MFCFPILILITGGFMSKFIAINTAGEITIHGTVNYGRMDTVCGMDADDPSESVDQMATESPKKPKINCNQCKSIILDILRFDESDLAT